MGVCNFSHELQTLQSYQHAGGRIPERILLGGAQRSSQNVWQPRIRAADLWSSEHRHRRPERKHYLHELHSQQQASLVPLGGSLGILKCGASRVYLVRDWIEQGSGRRVQRTAGLTWGGQVYNCENPNFGLESTPTESHLHESAGLAGIQRQRDNQTHGDDGHQRRQTFWYFVTLIKYFIKEVTNLPTSPAPVFSLGLLADLVCFSKS